MSPPPTAGAIEIRLATLADADGIAEIHLQSIAEGPPWLRLVHSAVEVHEWVASHVVPELETWVAEAEDGTIVGMLSLAGDQELDHLYLLPGWWRRGVGRRFVELAKELRAGGLELWCFQRNERGLAFYRAMGFEEVHRTDGAGNEEREPDVRLAWRPAGASGSAAGSQPSFTAVPEAVTISIEPPEPTVS